MSEMTPVQSGRDNPGFRVVPESARAVRARRLNRLVTMSAKLVLALLAIWLAPTFTVAGTCWVCEFSFRTLLHGLIVDVRVIKRFFECTALALEQSLA